MQYRVLSAFLQSPGILQQLGQVPLDGLQIRVPTDMFLRDEDIGHGALARHVC